MKKIFYLMLVILCGRLQAQIQQQLVFGETTNLPGATLEFEAASNFVSASGFCFPTVSGSYWDKNLSRFGDPDTYSFPYAGYYYNCVQTFNALPATEANGGPVVGAAAMGTVIQLQLLSVEGPAGANFAFWEGNRDGSFGTNLTWSVPVPSSGDTNLIRITQAANTPTNDPYGLVANRVFGFTKPGLYKLTWQLVDTSTNGPGGTPLDLSSAPFSLYYQADYTICGIARVPGGMQIIFAAPTGSLQPGGDYQPMVHLLEQSPRLGAAADWQPALDAQHAYISIDGDDYLHTNTVPAPGATRFYRLNVMPPTIGG